MNKNINVIDKPSINMVSGFKSNGISCEIRKKDRLDLGMVISDSICQTYAKYTTNKVQSAHITVCKEKLTDNKSQAVIVNSGIANACTGELGVNNSHQITKEVAKTFGINDNDVLTCSTGVIGKQLPMDKIINGIKILKEKIAEPNEKNFSLAIMTTDTIDKIVGVEVKTETGNYKIVGTAKGSGMIHPNMATLLSYIFTDVKISPDLLKNAFDNTIEKSFNSVSIDGDTSTNDTVIIMNNGLSNNKIIDNTQSDEHKIFVEALDFVTTELAKKIALDGEGATKFIEINVIDASSDDDAKKIGMTIAKSNLVKTAFFGEDANWGRIICAAGYSGVDFNFHKVSLRFGELIVFQNGEPTDFSEEKAKEILKKKDIKVTLDMNTEKKGKWTVWTSDFSYDYVKINASYRT